VGALAGEVTGPPASTVVTNAVSANTANAVVRRDGTGSFSAGSITLSGDLHLPATASSGVITLAGSRFLHGFGTDNTFLGTDAGNFTMTGAGNTAVGANALSLNTGGPVGFLGSDNTAVGTSALRDNTAGGRNTAVGANALVSNSGLSNTAVGKDALGTITTGSSNTALGAGAGLSHTLADSSNIDITNQGVAGDNNTIRIGTQGSGLGQQNRTFIAGIFGVMPETDPDSAVGVVIDSAGQLGTIPSSRRVKTDIRDMRDTSEPLLRLRPVSFRYTAHADRGPRQYGLIAEEVAEVLPDLVVYDQAGEPQTVRYHLLPAMLLNELQKQHRRIVEQAETTTAMRAQLSEQARTIEAQAETIAGLKGALMAIQARFAQLERLLPLQAAK
jgi:hypothetical protein